MYGHSTTERKEENEEGTRAEEWATAPQSTAPAGLPSQKLAKEQQPGSFSPMCVVPRRAKGTPKRQQDQRCRNKNGASTESFTGLYGMATESLRIRCGLPTWQRKDACLKEIHEDGAVQPHSTERDTKELTQNSRSPKAHKTQEATEKREGIADRKKRKSWPEKDSR